MRKMDEIVSPRDETPSTNEHHVLGEEKLVVKYPLETKTKMSILIPQKNGSSILSTNAIS